MPTDSISSLVPGLRAAEDYRVRGGDDADALERAFGDGPGVVIMSPGLWRMSRTPSWGAAQNVVLWVLTGVVVAGGGGLPANAGSNVIRQEPTVVVLGGSPSAETYGAIGSAGISNAAARSDHLHGMPAAGGASFGVGETAAETFGAAAADGVSADSARADHRHAMPATPVAATGLPALQAFDDASYLGNDATHAARADHIHGMPSTPIATTGTPAAEAIGSTAALGVDGANAARSDHRHAMPAFAGTGTAATVAHSDHNHLGGEGSLLNADLVDSHHWEQVLVSTVTAGQLVAGYDYYPINGAATLPAYARSTRITVQNVAAGAVVLSAGAGQTINGSATVTLASTYDALTLVFDAVNGSSWRIG